MRGVVYKALSNRLPLLLGFGAIACQSGGRRLPILLLDLMDDGEVDFSNQELFLNPVGDIHIPSNDSMDSFFDELLKDTHACTHTHTCNPQGPDYSHTHTCFHVHTKILSAPSDHDDKGGDTNNDDDSAESVDRKKNKKRPLGNREAVRKYREKKKARTASLEDEVARLTAINQQLMKRLQGQAALEAEAARLKCLLVDIRGRIEGEIGSFPYQKPCNVQCNVESASIDQGFGGCDFDTMNCFTDIGPCDVGSLAPTANIAGGRRKGGNRGSATADQGH